MFKNFKAIAHMRTPIATIDPIILDSIILAAKMKTTLKDEYYSGENKYGTKDEVESVLGPILNKQNGVYCTSVGIGDNREYAGSWVKRWDDNNDDIVDFGKRGKQRINTGSGSFKNYHMPIVLKSYKTITFYVNGDMEEVKRLLENHIFYLGKKGNQGYGQIREWEFIEIDEDWSVWKDGEPMRPIPVSECEEYISRKINLEQPMNSVRHPTIPPYWRRDNIELCVIPYETKTE